MQLALTLGLLKGNPKATNLLASIAKNSRVPLARDLAMFVLPAKPPARPPPPVAKAAPLSADEQKRFDAGKGIYEQVCLACHQQHGLGQPGLAPPLVGSEWVAGSEKRMIRIVLQGMRGKLKVKGEEFELDMPSLGVLDDEQVAAVLTYVRREWGHALPAVSPETVQQVRKETENREDAWTMGELLKIP
jgi:mono/diheme cytochrome c family protein